MLKPNPQCGAIWWWGLWELIFVYSVKVQLYSFACGYSVFQYQLLKRLCFTHGMVLASMLNISWPCMWAFVSGTSVLVYISVFMLISHSFDYYSFVINSEIKKCDWSKSFFFKIVLLFMNPRVPCGF